MSRERLIALAASGAALLALTGLALVFQRQNDFDRFLEPMERRSYRIRSPLRLLDVHAHAGFWSDGWGVLPFWFSREDLDELSIYRVKLK